MAIKLKFEVGGTVQLQVIDSFDEARYVVNLIGYLDGQSLIVTAPVSDGKLASLREGQNLIVRIFSGNRIYGFSSTVLKSARFPFHYLHLAYPEEVQNVLVRKARRVSIELVVLVHNNARLDQARNGFAGAIIDISRTGALLVAKRDLGTVGDRLSLEVQFVINCRDELVTLGATVRSKKEVVANGDKPAHFQYGLEFLPMAQPVSLVLQSFLYEHLAGNDNA